MTSTKEQMYNTIITDLTTAILKQSELLSKYIVDATEEELEKVKYTNKLLKSSLELFNKIENE